MSMMALDPGGSLQGKCGLILPWALADTSNGNAPSGIGEVRKTPSSLDFEESYWATHMLYVVGS